MAAKKVLERLLILCTAAQQEVGPRIADAIAEYQVQAIRNLVDEIVHVAVKTAVVVAGKQQPTPVIQEDPAGEMDGADARQAPARVDLSCTEVQHPENKDQRPKPKAARLDAAERTELVADVVILQHAEGVHMLRRGARRNDCIGLFALTQLIKEEGQIEQQERKQGQKRERNADQVTDLACS